MRMLLSFGVMAVLAAAQPKSDALTGLTGRWRSAEVSPSGVSAVFEIRDGKQLDSYSAVINEGKYRLAGTDTILLGPAAGREEKLELEWDNADRARIEDEAAGKSIELVRLGKAPDSQNQLAGEWTTTREWNGRSYPARAVFFESGRVVWITHLRDEHGSYSIHDQNIRLEMPNRPPLEGKFALGGDRLTLPNPKGGLSIFERF